MCFTSEKIYVAASAAMIREKPKPRPMLSGIGFTAHTNSITEGSMFKQNDENGHWEKLDGIYNDVEQARQAIEWLQDHSPDEYLASNLGMIRTHLGRTEIKLHVLLGRPGYENHPLYEPPAFD